MRFDTDRTVRHRSGLEAFHDAFSRFDFFDRNRILSIRLELHQLTQRVGVRVRIDFAGELFVLLIVSLTSRLLQTVDCARIVQVFFTHGRVLEMTAHSQRFAVRRCSFISTVMTHSVFSGDFLQSDTFNTGRRACEIFSDNFTVDSQCFKNLCTVITAHC